MAKAVNVSGFILAGGASSRMGVNKAALLLGGRSLAGRAADALSAVSDSVVIVASDRSTITDLNLPCIKDVAGEARGAIRGLVTALENCERDWAIVLACDLPFVSGELLTRLIERTNKGVDVVLPVQPDGRSQPLCAVYRRETCLPAARDAMAQGRWSLQALVRDVRARRIEPADYADLPGSRHFFTNINSPADLAAAEDILRNENYRIMG